ncbi:hypothetical protein [Staphylospora marina]|uniref:hypothetical protein n=1 Tax=Staphylospora marina TaxID=2490858 RepID=UPI000F5C1668|nr:hypothetical protein [Staphylospora marina]
MKRFASALLAVALGFANWFPAGTANAEEAPALKVGYKMEGEKAVVTASLENAKESKGTWTFSVYNEKVIEYTEVTDLERTYVFQPEIGKQYPINVEYVGKIDGQDHQFKEQVIVEVNNNQGSSQPGGNDQNNGSSEQKEQVELVLDAALFPNEEVGTYELALFGHIKDAKKVDGTWTVETGGKKHQFKGAVLGGKEDPAYISLGKGNRFTVTVSFSGTVDGKQVTGSKTLEVNVPVFKVDYEAVGGKHKLSGKIEGAKNVEGDWIIGVADPETYEEVVKTLEVTGSKNMAMSYEFELKKAGEYLGVVMFGGYVDGVFMILGDEIPFEVTGKGGVKKPSEGKDHSPVLNPEEGKKQLDEAKKGGKLPKTATTHPTGAAAGLALLIGGLALLKLRRTA